MTWWVVVSSRRLDKQGAVARALLSGMPLSLDAQRCIDEPPVKTDPFIATGQMWVVERIVPPAIARGQPFYLIDNGYYLASGKGKGTTGHYEVTYRGLSPILIEKPDFDRFPADKHLRPWRTDKRGYVLVGLPGPAFGRMIGLDMTKWSSTIVDKIKRVTNLPIKVRDKWSHDSLDKDLDGARVVVTHSSNIAVDAIVRGIPAIVSKHSPAAPVCSTNLFDILDPALPDRTHWWASLMCQQFTLSEMSSGLAWHWMQRVREQVDGLR